MLSLLRISTLWLIMGFGLAHDGLHAPFNSEQKETLKGKINAFEQRLQKNENDLHALVKLGYLYEQLGRNQEKHIDFEKSIAYFQRVLRIDPDHQNGLHGLCRSQLACHHFGEGLITARRLAEMNPQALETWLLLGDAHFFLGNYAEAASFFDQAHRKKESFSTCARMAQLYEIRGDYANAFLHMQKALAFTSGAAFAPNQRAWVLTMLAELDLQTSRVARAREHFTQALEADKDSHYAFWRLAVIDRHQGKFEQARERLHTLVHQQPRIDYLFSYGDIWLDLGRKDRAAYWHQKAINKVLSEIEAGDMGHVRSLVAHWAVQGEQLGRALKLALSEYAEVRQDGEGAALIGWLYYLNGDAKAGLPFMNRALRLGISTPQCLLRAALISHAAGEHFRAAQLLKLGLKPGAFISPKLMEKAKTLKDWYRENPTSIRDQFRLQAAKE